MKAIKNMTQAELAAYVQSHLRNAGIKVVLSGGAAVGIYTKGEYVSMDIDLVNAQFTPRETLKEVMSEIGFIPVGRHFEHPDSDHIIEFPPGPLILGNARVEEIIQIEYDTGTLQVISPADCVKDRLAHYYHWGDRQCLAQAVLVAESCHVDLMEIEEWSKREGKQEDFNKIKNNFHQ